MKVLIHESGRRWLVRDEMKDFHTQFGPVPSGQLKPGLIENTKGQRFSVLEASYIDMFRSLQRRAQVILPKDAAMILATTGAGRKDVVVDAGAGSGWLACFLGHHVRRVYTYDIVESHVKIASANAERMGLTNVSCTHHDIYSGIPKKCDILTLDVPEPWRVLPSAQKKVKRFVVCYNPSITQSQRTVNEAKDLGLVVWDVHEVAVRSWDIDGQKVRPKKDEIGPTGFLTYLRVV